MVSIQKRAEESIDDGLVLTFPEVNSVLKPRKSSFL